MNDPDLLTGLSIEELEALAGGLLAPAAQSRLNHLLSEQNEGSMLGDDRRELDRLLEVADQLTILKTRARYTLSQLKVGTPES